MPTPFESYIDKLIRVFELITQDKDEGKEGDNLREYLDDNDKNLSEEDQKWVKNLPGDLYMLSGKDMYYKVPPEEKKKLKKELRENIKQKKWVEVLAVLRASLGISRQQIAAYRAIAWKDKSLQVSALFEKYAEVLKTKGE